MVVWGIPYGFGSAYSFYREEIAVGYPLLREVIPQWVFTAWFILGIILLLIIFIEGSYRFSLKYANHLVNEVKRDEVEPLREKIAELEKLANAPRVRRLTNIRKPKLKNLTSALDTITKKVLQISSNTTIPLTIADSEELGKALEKRLSGYGFEDILRGSLVDPKQRMWELTCAIRYFCDGKNYGIKLMISEAGLQGDIDRLDTQVTSVGDRDLTDSYHDYLEILYNIGTLEMQPDDISSMQSEKLVSYMEYRDELKTALDRRFTDINKRIETLDLGG